MSVRRPHFSIGKGDLATISPPVRNHDDMASYDATIDPRLQRGSVIERIPLGLVDPSPFQRRVRFDEVDLRALGASYSEVAPGLIGPNNPPLVRPKGDRYELIAGERRVRAAEIIGLPFLGFIVRELDDLAAQEATALENLEREDLLPWELAQSYLDLRKVARARGARKNAGAGIVAREKGRHARDQVSRYIRAAEALSRDLLEQAGAYCAPVLEKLGLEEMIRMADVPTEEERLDRLRRFATQTLGETVWLPDSFENAAASEMCETSATEDSTQDERRPAASVASAQTMVPVVAPAISQAASPVLPTPPQPVEMRGGAKASSARRTYEQICKDGDFQKRIRPPVGEMAPEEAKRHLEDLTPVIAALAARAFPPTASARSIAVEGAPTELWVVPSGTALETCNAREGLRALNMVTALQATVREKLVENVRKKVPAGERFGLEEQLKKLAAAETIDDLTPGQRALSFAFGHHATGWKPPLLEREQTNARRQVAGQYSERKSPSVRIGRPLDQMFRSTKPQADDELAVAATASGAAGEVFLHCSGSSHLQRQEPHLRELYLKVRFQSAGSVMASLVNLAGDVIVPSLLLRVEGSRLRHTIPVRGDSTCAEMLWFAVRELKAVLQFTRGAGSGKLAARLGVTPSVLRAASTHADLVDAIRDRLEKRSAVARYAAAAQRLAELA